MILDSTKIGAQLKKWSADGAVKAIVLRIDSPGGAVAPSQEIFAEVERAARKKPVVASMGAVAASGGYYVASPCKAIFANPGTVTGSIGVIMNLANMEKLLDKIGWSPVVIKSGKFKDAGSPFRPMSGEEKQYLQDVSDDIHGQFIEDVARARKMAPEAIRRLADGRIFTGREAVKLHLVDKLGGLRDAVEAAAKMGGMAPDPRVVEDKESHGLLKWLFEEKTSLIPGSAGLATGYYYLWSAW
jgi:protease-4